ncbi:MAG: hypothetical protein IKN71_05025 [Alphaproteobacteria bacterium]|jgi:hypothetical protein|nr:hypothetical protein [Alphaproteobacteria bacterium]
MQKIKKDEYVRLEDSLMFAGTIYESFEALEEVMGKLKLERPLFLIYMAKKEFAEAVFRAAGEKDAEVRSVTDIPPAYIEIFNSDYQNMQ